MLAFTPGQRPTSAKEIRSFARVNETKRLVREKAEEMKALDQGSKDVDPLPDRVSVLDQKVSSFSPFKRRHKYTGSAEFDSKGEPLALSLQGKDSKDGYRYERRPDGSEIFVAPDPTSTYGVQLVHEKPSGVLFIDDPCTSDYNPALLNRRERNLENLHLWGLR